MANAATLKSPNPQLPPAAQQTATLSHNHAFAMLSHPGRVRHINQDVCAALPESGIFVVCDGVGGAAAGEIASRLAAEAFLHALSLRPRHAPPKAPPASAATSPRRSSPVTAEIHPSTRLCEAVRTANQTVFRQSRRSPAMHGMGTTLVAALLEDAATSNNHPANTNPTLWLAHVGDSRCYRFRHGILHQLTQDHSLVEEQVRAGLMSRSQANRSPIRNIITRAVGSHPNVEPDIVAHPTIPGDLYLLATDGLTRELDDAEIARILIQPHPAATPPDLEALCQSLIDAANAHGGRDNVTVLLLACPNSD